MSDEAERNRSEAFAHRMSVLADTAGSPDQIKEARVEFLMDFTKAERALGLHWTTERPTMPGWYWYRQDQGSVPVVMMIHSYRPETFWLTFTGQWAGPLEIPA